MKKLILAAILVTASLQMVSASTIDFSNSLNATINFDGAGNFTFNNVGTYDFDVTNIVGLNGNIGGTYTIGAITIAGPLQTAPVSGSGPFSVFDGVNTLTATVAWVDIFTFGTGGGTNSGGVVNLTGVSYTGTNASLLALSSGATAALTFQFQPAKTLTQLKSNADSTSYSGSISAIPEPMTFSLMGVGLLGLGLLRKRITK